MKLGQILVLAWHRPLELLESKQLKQQRFGVELVCAPSCGASCGAFCGGAFCEHVRALAPQSCWQHGIQSFL